MWQQKFGGVYILAVHRPGKENIIADLALGESRDSHKGMLYLEVLKYPME